MFKLCEFIVVLIGFCTRRAKRSKSLKKKKEIKVLKIRSDTRPEIGVFRTIRSEKPKT